ncbi:hypothetical protein AAF712_013174 [Marasmius tenuissimus]|uniref:AMP-dependent synthetase/ligase domain-containing protein n=1 Tax=Marasmius tenuissimus TaxID=585030 RepID=A0ABR2ZEI1_9AGAR
MSTIQHSNSVLKTPLTNLKRAATLWPSETAFKVPIVHSTPGHERGQKITGYSNVTYTQLFNDIEATAQYWYDRLTSEGLNGGCKEVIGVCLEGNRYTDVVHIYALMRAGYVPQTFSLFPDALEALNHLLNASGARALVYQRGVYDRVAGLKSMNPTLKIIPTPATIAQVQDYGSMPHIPNTDSEDPTSTQIIFHTSGSTSGLPKAVRYSARLIDVLITKAAVACAPQGNNQDVASWV